MSRSRNAIFFNISVNPNESDDSAVVKGLLSNMDLDISIIGLQRLGNSSSNNRPLRITFIEDSFVITLIKSKSKLRSIDKFKRVWVNADLSPSQREHIKLLRQEIQQKKESGENNWYIKYIHGTPSLSQKN